MSPEFALIHRYFVRAGHGALLGPGDDCALLEPGAGQVLAVTSDTLVSGTHFLPDTDAWRLGWKSLAVNLSDLAAMGAQPRWVTLALTLPAVDHDWLHAFSGGFFACAERYGVGLIGGDTTRGPLALNVTALGEVPAGAAIRRGGARAGDDIWISGQPGRAALGLAVLQGRATLHDATDCIAALEQPEPRVALGLALRGVASAMIDVSDGLLADIGHIASASGLAARIDDDALPWPGLLALGADRQTTRAALLSGGDDYELLFCAAPDHGDELRALAASLALPLARIGCMTAGAGVGLFDTHGREVAVEQRGYDHFA